MTVAEQPGINMKIPNLSIEQLLEAGVHLGHKTLRWNPRMKKFIYGEKNSIHIIDLTQTVVMLKNAMKELHKCISGGGKILIVSTKADKPFISAPCVVDKRKTLSSLFVIISSLFLPDRSSFLLFSIYYLLFII